ncbi:MAG: sugar ABC transporter ATP-binding protein [Acidobacteriota bacterium]
MSVRNDPFILEMRGISKSFPGVLALDRVSFDLRAGEIHALVGENGAGKTTLMKILGGVYPQYEGEIRLDGRIQRFKTVRDSARSGIAVIYQELSLAGEMSVAENIFLSRLPQRLGFVRWNKLYADASHLLARLHLQVDPRTPARELGIGQQQMIEIAKALSQHARILVLDEPTAALTDSEAETLFAILDKLRDEGVAMIYISHKLKEVLHLSDRITVLRDGRVVDTREAKDANESLVITAMVGREVNQIFPRRERATGGVIFEARDLTVRDRAFDKTIVERVSLTVRRGEVLGIAGLMGAGRTDLLMALFGAHAGQVTGEIFINNRRVRLSSPADAICHGLGFVTEDRKRFGLVMDQTILKNITLAALGRLSGRLLTHPERESAACNRAMGDLRIKAASLQSVAGTLSGGNQQKTVLAKWLMTAPRVLLLDEPTRGIDVGAKQEIYALINRLAAEGMAIIMVSSELPEVLGLSDRVMVLREGRAVGEFAREEATPEKVIQCAMGG